MSLQLHHVAKKITSGSLPNVVSMFELLGCKLAYQPKNATWAMVKQEGIDFRIQLAEVSEPPMKGTNRIRSHVAFISDNPEKEIEKIEQWAMANSIRFEKGGWSHEELWFDLPDLFVDWVIEVMNVSILKK